MARRSRGLHTFTHSYVHTFIGKTREDARGRGIKAKTDRQTDAAYTPFPPICCIFILPPLGQGTDVVGIQCIHTHIRWGPSKQETSRGERRQTDRQTDAETDRETGGIVSVDLHAWMCAWRCVSGNASIRLKMRLTTHPPALSFFSLFCRGFCRQAASLSFESMEA